MTIIENVFRGTPMKTGDNVRLRTDGRFEARYAKGRDDTGKIVYGCCYGRTYEEAVEKRNYQQQKMRASKQLNLLILGAGNHGEEVFEIARAVRVFRKISFLDDEKVGERIIGKWADAEELAVQYPVAIPAVGAAACRKEMQERLSGMGFILPVLIHPTAVVSARADIGDGSVICAGAVLDIGAKVGKGCIVSSGATVGRGAALRDWSFLDNGEVMTREATEKE